MKLDDDDDEEDEDEMKMEDEYDEYCSLLHMTREQIVELAEERFSTNQPSTYQRSRRETNIMILMNWKKR